MSVAVGAALALAACTGCFENPEQPPYRFEVKTDQDLLQLCTRLEKEGGPSCSDFEAGAAIVSSSDTSDPQSVFPGPAIARNQLPPSKQEIRTFLRFEGLFVPGSHSLPRQPTKHEQAKVILTYMLQKSKERFSRLDSEDQLRNPRVASLSVRQRIVLASIVEKEAVSNRNYPEVASVFLNRLDKTMALGSCPTVEYGLGYHRPFLLFKDLELQSDYNVYKRGGLPPGPIAQFSDDAYRAVLRPASTKDIFFVYDWTTGDLDFAEEYSDHKRNAARARSNFIEKYGRDQMYRRFDNLYYEDLPEPEYGKGD
ncbi:MAG: endolytic transglycosylase MltG [Leptospiraceae bacterium]|nr:endolytic transglycosylase MltG [Leptospiraceae bacterium]